MYCPVWFACANESFHGWKGATTRMARAETTTGTARAPRGAKPVAQAFLAALDSVPEGARSAVVKAAQMMIRDELKNRRDKLKAAAAKEKARRPAAAKRAPKASAPESAEPAARSAGKAALTQTGRHSGSRVALCDAGRANRSASRSDRLFEFLGRPERDFPARLDLNRLSGRGIAAHPRRTILDLNDPEAADAHAFARLEMIDQLGEHLGQRQCRPASSAARAARRCQPTGASA